MDLRAYLARIEVNEGLTPDSVSLKGIQSAHLRAVPFENLDIHLGRPITLDETALFAKVVTKRRGGFCYELNGLLAAALEALGYGVQRLSARSANDDGSYSPEFDHLLLRVTCPGEPAAWLVDVAWGNGPRYPLRMEDPGEQVQEDRSGRRTFRLRREGEGLVLEERGGRGLAGEGQASQDEWVRHYCFTAQPRRLPDFEARCRYHQTSPESIFTRQRLVTCFTPGGRITLAGLRLIEMEAGRRSERVLADEDEARYVLRERFGLVV